VFGRREEGERESGVGRGVGGEGEGEEKEYDVWGPQLVVGIELEI
jgi:hypothetical protein